jgi:glycosyltransferase involved in cell wall biosynthesis
VINFFGIVHQCGGCGTEALGAIELLRSRNVPARMIVPPDDPIIENGNVAADYLRKIGVELVQYQPGMFKDCKVLMSFGEGCRMFPLVKEHNDRPAYIVYSDCMYCATDDEISWQKEGLIDEFFFQTQRLSDACGPTISRRSQKAVTYHKGYRAFINVNSGYMPLRFSVDRPEDTFTVAKVCRDDPDKWHSETCRMWCGINAPGTTKVEVEVFGWGEKAAEKIGDPTDPNNKWHGQINAKLNGHVHDPKEMADLYSRAHVLLHVADYTWEEAMSRAFLEAIAAGVVIITDNRGGAQDLIRDGETGFLVDTPDEASFRASQLAFDPKLRRAVAGQAYSDLVTRGHGNANLCFGWWKPLIEKGQ